MYSEGKKMSKPPKTLEIKRRTVNVLLQNKGEWAEKRLLERWQSTWCTGDDEAANQRER